MTCEERESIMSTTSLQLQNVKVFDRTFKLGVSSQNCS